MENKLLRRQFLAGLGLLIADSGRSAVAAGSNPVPAIEDRGTYEIYIICRPLNADNGGSIGKFVVENLLSGATHNEIAFKENGSVSFFNGFSFDRQTGKPSSGIGDNNTLRVAASGSPYSNVGEAYLVWRGTRTEFREKVLRAYEAATYINSQSLDYTLAELVGTAQNSNSVAYTIAQAIGVSYPDAVNNKWAPGHGRVLLPEGFRSFYDRYPPTMANQFDFYMGGVHGNYVGLTENLSASDIEARIKDEKINRTGQAARFFDPKNPFKETVLGADYYERLGAGQPFAKPVNSVPYPVHGFSG